MKKKTTKKLKKILEEQGKNYEKISSKIEKLYSKHSDKEPHETNMMEKMMTWYGIQMRVNDDDNESKIAELFIKGTNMGIIEGRKLLNNKENDKKTKDLIQRYVDFQEEYVEKFERNKKFGRNVSFAGGAWTWTGFSPKNQLEEM